jgi:hypothetical protein
MSVLRFAIVGGDPEQEYFIDARQNLIFLWTVGGRAIRGGVA